MYDLATHRLYALARSGLRFGRDRNGAESHHWRRARNLQPRGVFKAAARDAAILGGLCGRLRERKESDPGQLRPNGFRSLTGGPLGADGMPGREHGERKPSQSPYGKKKAAVPRRIAATFRAASTHAKPAPRSPARSDNSRTTPLLSPSKSSLRMSRRELEHCPLDCHAVQFQHLIGQRQPAGLR
jgi:hypothetical protein